MTVNLTLLVEDKCTRRGLIGEHGFAAWLETPNANLLFDTGSGMALKHNAPLLGVDLSSADKLVLSHGHYDHTGGLEAFLRLKGEIEVIGCPGLFDEKYGISPGEPRQYGGPPLSEAEYQKLGARFSHIEKPTEVLEGVWASGPVPRITDFETQEPTLFYKRPDGEFAPDLVSDDRSLGIITHQGLSVVLGCAHAGVINTLKHITGFTGIKKVHTVIGGPHLLKKDDAAIAQVVEALKDFEVEQVGLCHCLGARQNHLLFQAFTSRFLECETGTRLTL